MLAHATILDEQTSVVDSVVEDLLRDVGLLKDREAEGGPGPHSTEEVEFGVWHPRPQQGQGLRHLTDVGVQVQLDLKQQTHQFTEHRSLWGTSKLRGSGM